MVTQELYIILILKWCPMAWQRVDKSLNILGGMRKDELHWLAWKARSCDLVIEIGTWLGRSAYAMGMMVRGKVITIDTFDPVWPPDRNSRSWFKRKIGVPMEFYNENKDYMYSKCLENLSELIEKGKVEVIRGDSNLVIKDLQKLKGSVDMVFIDGDHSREGVARDILNYKPLIRKGGILCGHDFAKEVKEVVLDLLPESKVVRGCIWEYGC